MTSGATQNVASSPTTGQAIVKVGGASGPLYGTLFLQMGTALGGVAFADANLDDGTAVPPQAAPGQQFRLFAQEREAMRALATALATPCTAPFLAVALGSVIYGNLFRPVPKHIWQNVDAATFKRALDFA